MPSCAIVLAYGTIIDARIRGLFSTVRLPRTEQVQKLMGLSGSCYPLYQLFPHSYRIMESALGHRSYSFLSGQVPYASQAVHLVAGALKPETRLPRVWQMQHHGLLR